ncbi:maoc like domain protein [Nannochloropsis oceanica]
MKPSAALDPIMDLVSTFPVLTAVCATMLLLIAIVQSSTTVSHFYPSSFELSTLYGKLIVSPLYKNWRWKSQLKKDMKLNPHLEFKLPFEADTANVQAYVDMLGLQEKAAPTELPFAYVASCFLYPTVCLLSQRRYLFPVLGAIHVHNFFRWEPLKKDEKFEGFLKVQETVNFTKKGVEVTFPHLLLNSEGREVWRSTTTVLVPCRNKLYDRTNDTAAAGVAAAAPPTKRVGLVEEYQAQGLKPVLVREKTFKTKSDTGRRFAEVVQDYNPIHLFTVTARLFGFKRAICHGMYVGSLAMEEAMDVWRGEVGKGEGVMEADVKFIRPCFVGDAFRVKIFKVEDKKEETGKKLVVVVTQEGKEEICHLQATVRAAKKS